MNLDSTFSSSLHVQLSKVYALASTPVRSRLTVTPRFLRSHVLLNDQKLIGSVIRFEQALKRVASNFGGWSPFMVAATRSTSSFTPSR